MTKKTNLKIRKMIDENNAWFSELPADDGGSGERDWDEQILEELFLARTTQVAGPDEPVASDATVAARTRCKSAQWSGDVVLEAQDARHPAFWRLANNGAAPVLVTEFTCNGDGLAGAAGLSRMAEQAGAKTKRERAIWAYLYCLRHHSHGPAPLESWDDPRILDPATFFSAYGYGLCGHIAHAFVGLCDRLGLRSRVITMGGHTCPEVRLEDDWHIFDPNGETWYPRSDGRLGLGTEALGAGDSPDWRDAHFRPLGRGKRAETLFQRLADSSSHRVVTERTGHAGLDDKRGLRLAPGETATLWFERRVPWCSARTDRLWFSPFVPPQNARRLSLAWSGPAKALDVRHAPDRAVYQFQRNFPLQDVVLALSGPGHAAAKVCLTASETVYGPFEPVRGDGETTSYRLRRAILRHGEPPVDGWRLSIEHSSSAELLVELVAHYQYSQHVFPPPFSGRNTLSTALENEGEEVDLALEYGCLPAEGELPAVPFEPRYERKPDKGLRLTWGTSRDYPGRIMPHRVLWDSHSRETASFGYEVIATRAGGPFDLAAPHLHRFVLDPCLELDSQTAQRCVAEETLTWSIRVVDKNGRPLDRWQSATLEPSQV